MRWPSLLIVAVALLVAGMALVAAGVRIGVLFLPGVFTIGAGLVAAAAAGILSLTGAPGDDGAAA